MLSGAVNIDDFELPQKGYTLYSPSALVMILLVAFLFFQDVSFLIYFQALSLVFIFYVDLIHMCTFYIEILNLLLPGGFGNHLVKLTISQPNKDPSEEFCVYVCVGEQ